MPDWRHRYWEKNRITGALLRTDLGQEWGGGGGGGGCCFGERGGEGRGGVSLDPCSFPQQLLCTQSMHFKLRGNGTAVGTSAEPQRPAIQAGEALL